MPLNIKIQQVDKNTVKVILSGQINSDTYEALDRQINELVQKKISTLILDLADVGLGRNHPAEPPASHPEVLREAVHHEHVVEAAQRSAGFEAVLQPLVDLVHDKDAAAAGDCFAQCDDLVEAEQGARGVRR